MMIPTGTTRRNDHASAAGFEWELRHFSYEHRHEQWGNGGLLDAVAMTPHDDAEPARAVIAAGLSWGM